MPSPIVLLPRPQFVEWSGEAHRLQPDRFIWLGAKEPQSLLRAGRAVQSALETIGARWEITAARGEDPTKLGFIFHIDPVQVTRPEGYRIVIHPREIFLFAHDAAGAFYGAMTLRQLARCGAGTGAIPCGRIEDWPDFPNRGVMLDISRDKVPTLETLFGLVDLLAEWKINQLQLYTEHTFAYREHREVWASASPLSGEEILALDTHCRERHVQLVPNQNSFGHMERWMKLPKYRPLAEAPGGFTDPWGNKRDEPYGLCPGDPGALKLLEGLYEELLPHFSSRFFNVGCDETFDLGQGRSAEECKARGVGPVYLDFLLKIHKLCAKHGRTMMFWGDIIMHHPELIADLPKDLVAMEWGYEADHPFAADGEKFAKAGIPFYVCPGTSSWNTIAGRTENTIANIANAAENGLAHGAIGLLNTDWGDNGHWQHLPVSYLGYACGAAMSWAHRANRETDWARALDLHAFHDAAGVMGRVALDLGNAYKVTGALLPNNSVLSMLLQKPEIPVEMAEQRGLTIDGLQRTMAYIDAVASRLPETRMAGAEGERIGREFWNAALLLRHACPLGVGRIQSGRGNAAEMSPCARVALAEDLQPIIADYRRLWLGRNRAGGLAESAGRLERLLGIYEAR